ncbi:MFS transporter [Kingella denitrificans]|uniref:MFS transporter n=1 Tax=Kingella denitrificans TaxID=502 RepID=UPI0028D848F0|nr:MFS transporter [Kingella denitrificans]
MNMNKVWFYIAALAVVIAGVWLTMPSVEQQQKMREAIAKKKAVHAAAQTASQPAASKPQP